MVLKLWDTSVSLTHMLMLGVHACLATSTHEETIEKSEKCFQFH
jgi:hypothetical protein